MHKDAPHQSTGTAIRIQATHTKRVTCDYLTEIVTEEVISAITLKHVGEEVRQRNKKLQRHDIKRIFTG